MNRFDMGECETDKSFKIVIIGDSGVGKTCIIFRHARGTFTEEQNSTIGVDFMSTNMEFKNKKYQLQIWDTAGQERYRTITSAYYRDAAGIVMVYDVTSESSFQNIKFWYNSITEYGPEDALVMMVGNKMDLEEDKKVTKMQGEELAKELDIYFMETSAKADINIKELFEEIVEKIIGSMKSGELLKKYNDTVKLKDDGHGGNNQEKGNNGGCGCGN